MKKFASAHAIAVVWKDLGFVPAYKVIDGRLVLLVRCKNNVTFWFSCSANGWTEMVAKHGKTEVFRAKARGYVAVFRNVYRCLPSDEARQKLAAAMQ